MIEKENIKVGSTLEIAKRDLIRIASPVFVDNIDPLGDIDRFFVKVISISDKMCMITTSAAFARVSTDVDMARLAMLSTSVSLNGSQVKTESEKSDADRFKEITDKMSDTYKRKNHDYGNAFSEMYDELGINYGYGKIREKVNRIKTLKDDEAQVANESLEDSLLDCANYCILTLMEYQKRKEHGTN